MSGFELRKELLCVPASTLIRLLQALTNSFVSVCFGCYVKQRLIGICVLDNCSRLAIDRQHHWALALLQLLHELTGAPSECGDRLRILGNVQH